MVSKADLTPPDGIPRSQCVGPLDLDITTTSINESCKAISQSYPYPHELKESKVERLHDKLATKTKLVPTDPRGLLTLEDHKRADGTPFPEEAKTYQELQNRPRPPHKRSSTTDFFASETNDSRYSHRRTRSLIHHHAGAIALQKVVMGSPGALRRTEGIPFPEECKRLQKLQNSPHPLQSLSSSTDFFASETTDSQYSHRRTRSLIHHHVAATTSQNVIMNSRDALKRIDGILFPEDSKTVQKLKHSPHPLYKESSSTDFTFASETKDSRHSHRRTRSLVHHMGAMTSQKVIMSSPDALKRTDGILFRRENKRLQKLNHSPHPLDNQSSSSTDFFVSETTDSRYSHRRTRSLVHHTGEMASQQVMISPNPLIRTDDILFREEINTLQKLKRSPHTLHKRSSSTDFLASETKGSRYSHRRTRSLVHHMGAMTSQKVIIHSPGALKRADGILFPEEGKTLQELEHSPHPIPERLSSTDVYASETNHCHYSHRRTRSLVRVGTITSQKSIISPDALKISDGMTFPEEVKTFHELKKKPHPFHKRSASTDFLSSETKDSPYSHRRTRSLIPFMGTMPSQTFIIPKTSALARYKKEWAATTQSSSASSTSASTGSALEQTNVGCTPKNKHEDDVLRSKQQTIPGEVPLLSDLALLLSNHLKTATYEGDDEIRKTTTDLVKTMSQLCQEHPDSCQVLPRDFESKLAKSA